MKRFIKRLALVFKHSPIVNITLTEYHTTKGQYNEKNHDPPMSSFNDH